MTNSGQRGAGLECGSPEKVGGWSGIAQCAGTLNMQAESSDGLDTPTACTVGATGEHDANWPDWYAAYMVAEHAGKKLPE
jgi:hypothetical protein